MGFETCPGLALQERRETLVAAARRELRTTQLTARADADHHAQVRGARQREVALERFVSAFGRVDRLGVLVAAGQRDQRKVDGGRRRRLTTRRVVRAVVERDVVEFVGAQRADRGERAELHQQRAIAVEHEHLRSGRARATPRPKPAAQPIEPTM